ncbi:MAG: DM13 domain-containing protein [Pseudomonadota bacterium]
MFKSLRLPSVSAPAAVAIAVASFLALFSVNTAPAAALEKTREAHAQVSQARVAVTKTGTFKGLSRHTTAGGITIVKTDAGNLAILENSFSLDGAPAPTLGFGKNGKFDPSTEFASLGQNTGAQVYVIPASIDPAQFDEFYVWCADFSVPLGVAALR